MGVGDKDYQQGQGQFGGWQESTSKWYNPFSWGGKNKGWAANPAAFDYNMGVPTGWNQGAQDMSAMQFGNDARAQQMAMAQLLAQRAQGENLASTAMAQQQLEQGTGAIASRAAAAMRGGYDPATQRASLYATGALGGQVAGQAAIAAAQEQMAAAQAAAGVGQDVRGSDIQQGIGAQQLAMQLRQMGMQDKGMDIAARMAYENALKQGYLGIESEGAIGGLMGNALGTGLGYWLGGPQGAQIGGQWGGALGNWAGDQSYD